MILTLNLRIPCLPLVAAAAPSPFQCLARCPSCTSMSGKLVTKSAVPVRATSAPRRALLQQLPPGVRLASSRAWRLLIQNPRSFAPSALWANQSFCLLRLPKALCLTRMAVETIGLGDIAALHLTEPPCAKRLAE